jgi:hypothetical protein
VTGALPAAHKILAICWLLAVPVRLCSEYRLFRQSSTELPAIIGSGSRSCATVWFGTVAGKDWDVIGVLAGGGCTGEVAQAPANKMTTTRLNKSVFLINLIPQLIPTKASLAQL